MTITPTDLLEIERKARAYQAEEAANPDSKTCQRPTPELVLRLVEEVRKQTASRDTQYLERCKAEKERDELRAKVAELEAIVDRLIQIPKKYDNMRSIEYEQNNCASMRKNLDALGDGAFGIAVGKDEYAKRWQALDAEKTEIKKFISESFALASKATKGGAQ